MYKKYALVSFTDDGVKSRKCQSINSGRVETKLTLINWDSHEGSARRLMIVAENGFIVPISNSVQGRMRGFCFIYLFILVFYRVKAFGNYESFFSRHQENRLASLVFIKQAIEKEEKLWIQNQRSGDQISVWLD